MFFTAALLSLMAFTATAISLAQIDSAFSLRKRDYDCPKGVQIISSRGHSTDNETTFDNLGLLQSLLTDVEDSIKHTTPKTLHYNNTTPNIIPGVNKGTPKLIKKITNLVDKCPDANIVLLGYSEGAMITMNTLCGTTSDGYIPTDPLPKKYAKNIVAVIVYGDLTKPAEPQPYDMGTCTTEGTRPRQDPSLCKPFVNKIQSYCDTNDPYCCAGGTDYDVHKEYPDIYNTNATDFVVSMWQQQKGLNNIETLGF